VDTSVNANPIRKVVTMLQNVQKSVVAEGEKEEKMFEKYMCYCKNGVGTLGEEISSNEAKLSQLDSSLKEDIAKKNQLVEDLKAAKVDRTDAKSSIASATALRAKEAKAYAKASGDLKTNVAAISKAVAALEKGATGAFLQTSTARTLRDLVISRDMKESARDELMAFLQGTDKYAPQSGEITGILKEMGDEMSADLKDATAVENAAIASFDALVAAKTKEINALTQAIETKTQRSGELAMAIAQAGNDIEDTSESVVEDKKFLADLQKNCATKESEWAEIVKTRNEEILALAETIKLLNSDDALELFKQTLPSAASSLVQMHDNLAEVKGRARDIIRRAQGSHGSVQKLDFILLALSGKSAGFEKVIGMIDDMVKLLKSEQTEDDEKQTYCNKQFDVADDEKKSHENAVKNSETAIEAQTELISGLTDEINALADGIKALDKSVAEATANRKDEHAAFKQLMAEDGAAKDLLHVAKNRMNKFYNPALYKAPPKRQLSEEDRITVNMGGTLAPTQPPGGISGTGITALVQDAPAPPPEAPGPFKKKSQESNGVIAMMDILVKNLDKEMTEASTDEKNAQADYEQAMSDSAEKRAADSKSLADKQSAKADAAESLQQHEDDHASSSKELAGTLKYIHSLHGECDWLIKYYEVRKEARANEVDSLNNAKAVLNGADYSLLQAAEVSRHNVAKISLRGLRV